MRRAWLSVLVAALVPAPAAADVGDNAIGVNTHIPADPVVDLVVGLDAHWVRVDNNWRDQTDPCGTIGFFAPLDNFVTYAIANGLKVYMTLAYAPPCGSIGDGDGMPNNDVPNAARYGAYARQAVAH